MADFNDERSIFYSEHGTGGLRFINRTGGSLYEYSFGDLKSNIEPVASFKPGINSEGLNQKITDVFAIIDNVWSSFGEVEPVITSAAEKSSRHKDGSLHYQGFAIDIRGKNIEPEKLRRMGDALERRLESGYDVVVEIYDNRDYNHIHVEYDPKGGAM